MDIVFNNLSIDLSCVGDWVRYRLVCKEFKTLVDEHLSYFSKVYFAKERRVRVGAFLSEVRGNGVARICEKCSSCDKRVKYNPFAGQVRCSGCYGDLMTLTQSRKDYRLDDIDLSNLNCVKRYNGIYKKYTTLFWANDVIGLAMIKHGKHSYRDLLRFLTQPVYSKVMLKRREQFEVVLKGVGAETERESLAALPQIRGFLSNGSLGIRRIKKFAETYMELKRVWAEVCDDAGDVGGGSGVATHGCNGVGSRDFVRYMDIAFAYGVKHVVDIVEQELEMKRERDERQRVLTEALAEMGLNVRTDSELCKRYVDGDESLTLTEVTETMRRMDYLYRNTNYGVLIKQALDDAYAEAKRRIHDERGYVSDHNEYKALLRKYVDRRAISEKCQAECMESCTYHAGV